MKIEERLISDLKPYKNNPRKNENAVEYVANSIKEFGFKVPLVIDKDNNIVAGHTRYLACKELKIDKVPCVIADDLTEEQIKAFRLADNKVAEKSEWDFDLLDLELEDIELDMRDFGFQDIEKINYDEVDDLTEESYEEPCKKMLECPNCHHIDTAIHFKKGN